ncbi:hypothetical protein F444_07159 [Phytophthora nicotianae P1976]|uniref:Uncharacterized protein n=2 Tax=Phytophthora nicotianae TaxID=4792 RepID=A0A081AFJ7_PHYNI|nr:hypothetical protein F444_07159 [Phytophthora nicotianae P1976]
MCRADPLGLLKICLTTNWKCRVLLADVVSVADERDPMEMASVPNGSKYEVVVSESALGEMEAKKSSLKDEATQFCMMNVEAAIGSARMWTVVNVSVPVLAMSIPNVVIGYHQQVQMPP